MQLIHGAPKPAGPGFEPQFSLLLSKGNACQAFPLCIFSSEKWAQSHRKLARMKRGRLRENREHCARLVVDVTAGHAEVYHAQGCWRSAPWEFENGRGASAGAGGLPYALQDLQQHLCIVDACSLRPPQLRQPKYLQLLTNVLWSWEIVPCRPSTPNNTHIYFRESLI